MTRFSAPPGHYNAGHAARPANGVTGWPLGSQLSLAFNQYVAVGPGLAAFLWEQLHWPLGPVISMPFIRREDPSSGRPHSVRLLHLIWCQQNNTLDVSCHRWPNM